jgi:hypothetical protein
VRADPPETHGRKPWPHKPWVIPPPSHADVVWAMEEVREVYRRPDAPQRPQVCLEATSTPLVATTRLSIPAAPGPPARRDDEYERQGTAHLLMVFEPLAGQWGARRRRGARPWTLPRGSARSLMSRIHRPRSWYG